MSATVEKEALKRAAIDALCVQDGCNLCAISRAFARAMAAVLDDCRENGTGTDGVNRHPITVLFMSKMSHMVTGGANIDFSAFREAYEKVEEIADS